MTKPLDTYGLSHGVSRLSHAMQMLVELIPYTDDSHLPRVVGIACLEDWFINYRLLIEFMLLKPPSNCAGATTFVQGWGSVAAGRLGQLRADYGWASQDVSHIGIPKPNAPTGNIAPQALYVRAADLLDVVEVFVLAMEGERHPLAPMVRIALTRARSGVP